MRIMLAVVSAVSAALLLAACGERENSSSKVRNTARETAEGVDKTADRAIGKAQLEQKKKMENQLNRLQQNQNRQLNQALRDK